MEFEALKSDLNKRMQASIGSLDHNLKGLRTGRASVNLVDNIVVEGVYAKDDKMPMNQLATVSVGDARTILIQPWDAGSVKPIEKAISNANLGLNPQIDGKLIRIIVPALSEERRKELAKMSKSYGEDSKVAIRNIRRDGMESIKKMKDDSIINEDQVKKYNDQVQKITDDFIKEVDNKVASKEKEILSI